MDNLKYNPNIPDFVKSTSSSLETCFNLIRLQNNIKTLNIIKNQIDSSKLFISIDTESYERNHSYITEIGWIIFDKFGDIIQKNHYIIQEYLRYRNGTYVEDNKYNYDFGVSQTKPLEEVKRQLRMVLSQVNYIVGQGIKNDTRDLEKIGVDTTKFKEMNGVYYPYGVIDTQDLYAGNFFEKPVSLKKGLEKLSIPYRHLHNAGNDAYYTMKYFLKLIDIFDFYDTKKQILLNIRIPSDYKETDYILYRKRKKELRKQEKLLKKQNKNRRIYSSNNFDDDPYFFDGEDVIGVLDYWF